MISLWGNVVGMRGDAVSLWGNVVGMGDEVILCASAVDGFECGGLPAVLAAYTL